MGNERRMDQVILGLLSHESLTGYEIKKRMDTTLKFFWGGSFGSIYPALNSLEKQSLVTKEETKEGRRTKIIYTITSDGREHLKQWLMQPVLKDEIRYETLLKLFFGNELGSQGTLAHIDAFEKRIQEELPMLTFFVEQLSNIQEEEAHKYFLVTAMFGVETYKGYLKWCAEARKILS